MTKKSFYFFGIILGSFLIVSCGSNEGRNALMETSPTEDISNPAPYFIEFMACEGGPGFNSENMTSMIADYQKLLTDDSLRGAWGYVPAADTNAFGDTGWWELMWSSQEEADAAWQSWSSNPDAVAWSEKYADVLTCDVEARNALDAIFPIDATEFGELPESGYFFSEFHRCYYNEGSSKSDAVAFLPKYTAEVMANAEGFAGTSFHYGNYYAQLNEQGSHTENGIDFLWASFTNSAESMAKSEEVFETKMRSILFPQFSEFAQCDEVPDIYHGYVFYDADDKDFMPTF